MPLAMALASVLLAVLSHNSSHSGDSGAFVFALEIANMMSPSNRVRDGYIAIAIALCAAHAIRRRTLFGKAQLNATTQSVVCSRILLCLDTSFCLFSVFFFKFFAFILFGVKFPNSPSFSNSHALSALRFSNAGDPNEFTTASALTVSSDFLVEALPTPPLERSCASAYSSAEVSELEFFCSVFDGALSERSVIHLL